MAEVEDTLASFSGFAVKYDPDKNPFFKAIIEENLKKISSTELGKNLLASIAAAKPASRGQFPQGVNVTFVPVHINFTQSGFKRDVIYGDGGSQTIVGMTETENPKFKPAGCPFWIAGASANVAVDQTAANGQQRSNHHQQR